MLTGGSELVVKITTCCFFTEKEVKQLVSEILEEHEEYDTLSELLDDLDEFPPASVEGSDALVSEAGSPCAQNTSIVADNSTVQVQQAVVMPIAAVTCDSNVISFEARSEASELNSTYLSGYPGLVPPLRYIYSHMGYDFDFTQSNH